MKPQREATPPRWATRFLRWYCKRELAEDLEGDLFEYFERNVKSVGATKAKWIYIIDVFKFLRLYTVRKPNLLDSPTQWIMIRSYIRTSSRSLLRNGLFSSINIIGLAISMSVGLLMIGLLSDMKSYDSFRKNGDRIYRVTSEYSYRGNKNNSAFASTSLKAGKLIQESIPGIEKAAILMRSFDGDMTNGEKTVPLRGLWANAALFDVFTFPLISGDAATALKEPFSVVLTEESAKKMFGNADAIGKTILSSDREYTVTGVMKDVPVFSHMKFDILASLSTREIIHKDNRYEMRWDNMWDTYVYLLLPADTNLETLQQNLNSLSTAENKTVEHTIITLGLQPMNTIALGEDLNNSIGPVMASSNIWMIGILAFVVILSACFNYTNLSIARSLRRSKEVGVRKVIGAVSGQVMLQFIVESVMIALFALVLAFGIFMLLRPTFLSLNYYYQQMLQLHLSVELVLYFVAFAVLVGVAAGFFPALFFSKVNAIQVLKNVSSMRLFRQVTMRKALIIAQFTISVMFITATIIGYRHYKNVLAIDLGFKTENILNISLQDKVAEPMKKQLLEMPEVEAVSFSSLVTGVGNYAGTFMKYNNSLDSNWVYQNMIDEHYVPIHGHKFLAGGNFHRQTEDAAEEQVIVNEKVLKRFNIANNDPQKAVGEIVLVNRKPAKIIGVIKDYYYGKPIDGDIQETIFRYSSKPHGNLNVKISTTDWIATRSKIEDAWKKIDPIHPFEASFYDDQIEESYNDFSSRIKIIGSLSFLAICIAIIGLLGMVVFTAETRLKEVSIRKVLGATEAGLIFLMSRGFIALLSIAALIGVPATYFFFAKVALDTYVTDAPFPISELALGVGLILALALVMIITQTLKVARTNPASVLKNE